MFSLVQQASSFLYSGAAQPALALGSNTTKGNLLLVWCTASATPLFPDDGINTWISIVNSPVTGGYGNLQAWYAIAAITTTAPLTVNLYAFTGTPSMFGGVPSEGTRGNLTFPAAQFIEFSGNSSNPFAAAASATGSSTSPAASVTDSIGTTDLILGFVIPTGGQSCLPSAGWTGVLPAQGGSAIYAIESGTGTFTPTFIAAPTGAWGVIAAAFRAKGATHNVSGSVGASGAGATLNILSTTTAVQTTATADGSGNFSVALENDTYIIQPRKIGQNFSPQANTNVVVNGSNVTGVNFTPSVVSTHLALTPTFTDSFHRANENPLNPTNWAQDGTPTPPFDNVNQIISNECVMADATIVANLSGPYSGNGVSICLATLPNDQYCEVQVDALPARGTWCGAYLTIRSEAMDLGSYQLNVANNGDGTATFCVFTFSSDFKPSQIGNTTYKVWSYWFNPSVSFSIGDSIGFASIGSILYILHNHAVIGHFTDSTFSSGSAVIAQTGQSVSDVKFSNFAAGSAAISATTIPDAELLLLGVG